MILKGRPKERLGKEQHVLVWLVEGRHKSVSNQFFENHLDSTTWDL